jgi:L-lactate dehydrogenase complex protein LldE
LFATCFNDTAFPQTVRATLTVLERLGVDVRFPLAQTCCGQMHVNTGYRREAATLMTGFVDAFEGYEAVVSPSASCVATVRQHYPRLAEEHGDPRLRERIEALTPRVYEVSEFLIDVLGTVDVGAHFPHRVSYHPTCHSLRTLHLGDRPYRLLRAVRGLTLLDLPSAEECCGFGGTFAVKNPDVSVAMGTDKARHVKEVGAEVLVAADRSCLMHLGGLLSRMRAGVSVRHLVDVLAVTEPARRGTGPARDVQELRP